MTVQSKTQCPNCNAQFVLPQQVLGKPNAKARCKHCSTVFFVNQHLLTDDGVGATLSPSSVISNNAVIPDPSIKSVVKPLGQPSNTPTNAKSNTPLTPSSKSASVANSKPSGSIHTPTSELADANKLTTPIQTNEKTTSKKTTTFVSKAVATSKTNSTSTVDDDLIYDDMTLDDEQESDTEDFDLSELDKLLENPELITASLGEQSKANDFDYQANQKSAEAIDDNTDDAWLEQLLTEDTPTKNPENNPTQTNSTDEDLNQLLSDFGVESAAPVVVSQDEALAKMNARLKKEGANNGIKNNQSTFAMLFWCLGCLALTLLLAAQYVIFNLDSMVKNPAHFAKLQTICQAANCSLPSANLDVLTVTQIKHNLSQVSDSSTHSDIIAALVNQSNTDQLYPNLKVSVYGRTGIIGEFVASPKDYLKPPKRLLIAQQNQPIMFTIAVKNAKISRVEIIPFY